jgi:hypothetical protein
VLDFLLVALLALHLLLVDVAMAGPLACIWIEWRGTRASDPAADQLARSLAWLATVALLLGVLLGTFLLAIRWALGDQGYFRAVGMIPASRLWFGLAELIFYLACMSAYIGLWDRLRTWRLAHRLLALAASSNLLLHFPALFVIISVLSRRSGMASETLDRAGYWRLLLDAEVASRVVHVWLSSLAATGVVWMALALWSKLAALDATVARQGLIQRGAWLALIATLLQLPVGMWVTLEMPEAARESLFGGDLLASSLFGLSLLLVLLLAHTLSAVALGDPRPGYVRRSLVTAVMIVLLMVGTRWRAQELARAADGAAPILAADAR